MSYQIIFYPPGEKKNLVVQFYLFQNLSVRKKILRQLSYIEDYGLRSEVTNTRKLSGYDLWEIRILGKENIRMIAAEHKRVIYIVNIFSKKSNKTPKKELETSNQRFLLITKNID